MANVLAPKVNTMATGNALASRGGELRNWQPGIMDNVRNYAMNALAPLFGGDVRAANAYYRDKIQPTAEYLPGVGDLMAVGEARDAFSGGNYLGGTLLAAGAAAGLVPGVGDAVQKGTKTVANAIRDPMIATHNLSAENLRFATELGGLPMPSIAAAKVDHPLNDFGDITLVGDPSMVTPSAKNKVWVGDAYTGRQPRGQRVLSHHDAAIKAMNSDPRYGGVRVSDFIDMNDSIDDADYNLKIINTAIDRGLINPADYSDAYDLKRAAQKAIDYKQPDPSAIGIDAYGPTEMVLPQGFTPSGNRKKPKPYTLDNVMSEMKRDQASKAGAENFFYGSSSFRANQVQPLRSFSDVKAARDRILPEDQTKETFEAFRAEYDDLVSRVAEASGNSGMRSYDAAAEFLTDYAAGRGRLWNDVPWTKQIPQELLDEARALSVKARELPANYIEAKPQRAVSIGEFKGALVPQGQQQAVEMLKANGIDRIYEYASPEQKKELLRKFPELMFMFGVGAVGANALAAQQQPPEQY